MIRTVVDSRSKTSRRLLNVAFVMVGLAGLFLNLYLLSLRDIGADKGIVGCGGSSCEEVLASRWSLAFGIPVAAFGALTYLGLLFSLMPCGRCVRGALLALLGGGAVWFVFVQAVLLRQFCPWCLAVHGLAIVLLLIDHGLGGLRESPGTRLKWAYAAFLLIGLIQLYGPVPATYRIEGAALPVDQAVTSTGGEGRKVSFEGGRGTFDVNALPHIGSPDAKRVMVEYFDYQCQSCRVMSGYLSALVKKHPSDICVLLLPVPLDHGCNDSQPHGMDGHAGSCELAGIALAIWQVKPEAYPLIHYAFLSNPPLTPVEAMSIAREFVPASTLEAALDDAWIKETIRANISDWVSLSGKTDKLPKLLIRDKRILHGLPSSEEDFIRVMEQELEID